MKRLAGLSALALIISSTSGCGWIGFGVRKVISATVAAITWRRNRRQPCNCRRMFPPASGLIRCCRSRATLPAKPSRARTKCHVRSRCRSRPVPATTACRRRPRSGRWPFSSSRTMASASTRSVRRPVNSPLPGSTPTSCRRAWPSAWAAVAPPATGCVSSRAYSAIPAKSTWSVPNVRSAAAPTSTSLPVRSIPGWTRPWSTRCCRA